MRAQRALAAAAVAWVLAAGAAAPSRTSSGDTPDALVPSALRLGMLNERIAKLHAQLGQGVLAQRSRRALSQAVRDFDTTLRSVTAQAPTPELRDTYALLGLLWQEYRDWAQRPATRENARKLRERNEEVAWVAAKGARLAQEHSRATASASAVRAAGAALLSQRIAKLHLWRRWEFGDEDLARELREAQENLQRALDTLAAARDTTPEIAAELRVADDQLRFMADAARGLDARSPPRQAEFIAKTGDNLLETLERATRMYLSAAP